jgi:hypothetical protein
MKTDTRLFHPWPRLVLPLILSALLTACVSAPPTLYRWDGYQSNVYSYLKNDASSSPEKQIADMEENLQKIRASGKNPPPGYYAHLGLLYANVGKPDLMAQNFHAEEQLFPESVPYMNYLLSKTKK